ncbi:MAG TPA: hypothetical protein VL475_00495, partial [Planctomycetaceae bacterium]|nr:hypothetical protein [Planctomycetaceae bacterium]
MSGLRLRVGAFCMVLAAAALCFSLQPVGIVTADEQNQGNPSAKDNAQDAKAQPADAANPADAGKGKSATKKASKAPAKKAKPAAKKKGQSKNGNQAGAGNGGNAGQGGVNGASGAFGALGAAAVPSNSGTGVGAATTGGGTNGGGGGAGAPNNDGPDPNVVKKVIDTQNKHTPNLLKQEGVVGTSTALAKDGSVVLKIYTSGAGKPQIPDEIDGVKTQVVLSGQIRPLNGTAGSAKYDPQARAKRPVPIGVSSAPQDATCAPDLNCYSGTLGCRLKGRDGSGVYALSNNHVFANENGYSAGKPIMQPSPGEQDIFCQCITADQIGQLYKFKTIVTGDFN